MVLAWPIANKLGKQKAVTIGLAISVVGGLVSFLDIHNFTIVCIGVILKGIGSIPAMYVTLALLSDVLDHLEAKNGFRSDGFTMSVYGAIMVGMTGLGNGLINALLTATGYDASASVQNGGVQSMLALCYLGAEIICYAVIVILMCFLKVEKHIEEDQKTILQHQKKAVLEAGGVWIEPAERLRMEQEEAERMQKRRESKNSKHIVRKKAWILKCRKQAIRRNWQRREQKQKRRLEKNKKASSHKESKRRNVMSEKREKQTKSKRRIWRGVTTATASLLTLSMSATLVIDGFRTDIDKFLGTQSTKMVTEDVSAEDYTFQSDYSSTTELLDSIEDLGERMNEEGSVLLKNENAALPLSKEETQKISLLGFSSYYPVQGGDFGSTLSENKGTDADTVDMLEAFESKGFEMNPTLKKMYQGLKEEFKSEAVLPWGVTTYYRATAPATTGVFTSLEPETATLDEAEPNWKKSMTDYNVMIVTLARAAGENANYTPGEDG